MDPLLLHARPIYYYMERDMDITSKWEYDGKSLSVEVTGKTRTTTITVCSPGCATATVGITDCGGMSFIGNTYTAIGSLRQDMEEVVQVWKAEEAVKKTLLAMVDLPTGYDEPHQWRPECDEDGLSWHLYLLPDSYHSLVLSVYLETDLCIDRYMPLVVNRYLHIEGRRGDDKPALLERFFIPENKGIITMETIREYMAGDPLNLNGLCKMFDLHYPIT